MSNKKSYGVTFSFSPSPHLGNPLLPSLFLLAHVRVDTALNHESLSRLFIHDAPFFVCLVSDDTVLDFQNWDLDKDDVLTGYEV